MSWIVSVTWITAVILELIHAFEPRTYVRGAFIISRPNDPRVVPLVTLNNFLLIARLDAGDVSFQGVPYQLSTVA